MTWDEAVAVMKSGRMVNRPRSMPLCVRAAHTTDGENVRVFVTAGDWSAGQPVRITKKHREATDWEICTRQIG